MERLTTIVRVKDWLQSSAGTPMTAGADVLLDQLIVNASQAILNYCGRQTFGVASYDDWYDGGGRDFLLIRHWPVQSLVSADFEGVSIGTANAANPPTSRTYHLEPILPGGGQQRLTLYGICLPRGRANIRVRYSAGFTVVGEAQVPTSAGAHKVTTSQVWLADRGVTLSGVAMVKVASGPITGQYAVDAAGTYTFAAAQDTATVLISYDAVPCDVEQAATEMVGERMRAREHIGQMSKALPAGGGTVSYTQKDISAYAKMMLMNYIRVTPA